jgi:hypothetical protein
MLGYINGFFIQYRTVVGRKRIPSNEQGHTKYLGDENVIHRYKSLQHYSAEFHSQKESKIKELSEPRLNQNENDNLMRMDPHYLLKLDMEPHLIEKKA